MKITKAKLKYRPASYWQLDNPLDEILSGISGEARRQQITQFFNGGRLEELDDELLNDTLSENTRRGLGGIHPFFMGGEYLPARFPGEVVIVRINLQSTTFDVIELRARPLSKTEIGLRWVDEYEGPFVAPTESIQQPFSFQELIDFISGTTLEGYDLPLGYNQMNLDWGADGAGSLRHFTSMSSPFYRELAGWMDDAVEKWVAEKNREQAEENGNVDEEEVS